MMPVKQQGVVLIWAVVTLLLLSLFVIRLLQSSELNLKMMSHYQQAQNVFYALETTLLMGEARVTGAKEVACLINHQDVNFTTRASDDWWVSLNDCQVTHHEVVSYYVIEDLGSEPCAQLANAQGNDELATTIAHFYRVSARTKLWGNSAMLLQSTVMVPELMSQPCLEEPIQVIHSTRQSWREIAF